MAAIISGLPVRRWMGDAGQRVPTWALAVGSIGFAWLGAVGMTDATGKSATTSATPTEQDLAALIDEGAVPSFPANQKDQYPRLFKTLGPRISEVEGLARQAAYIALRSGECDRVTLVGPSDTSTRDSIALYVDCENRSRVRLTEQEIKAGKAVDVDTAADQQARAEQKANEDYRLIAQAKTNVSRNLRDPGSADFGPAIVSRKDGIAVCGTVNAKNGFGGMTGPQSFINTQSNGIFLEEMRDDFRALWQRYCG